MVERTADARIRTTEWEDLQYKIAGNRVGQYRDREHEILAQRIMDAHQDVRLEAYDAGAEKVRDKLERGGYDNPKAVAAAMEERDPTATDTAAAAEDEDDEDDEFLAQYRAQRRAKLQEQVAANKFGRLRQVPGSTYVQEVTDASRNGTWVLATLIAEGQPGCDVLLRHFDTIAGEHPQVKFVYMIAREAIAKFPDKQTPTTLLYYDGALCGQVAGVEGWGGAKMTTETVKLALSRRGIIQGERDEDLAAADSSLASSKYYLKM